MNSLNRGYRLRNVESNEGGFTLIELIITIVVLAIAGIGVMSVFSNSMRTGANPLVVAQANLLVREKMEIIMGDRQNTARGFSWIIPANYPAENPITVPGFSAFSRSVSIYCVTSGDLNTNVGSPPCTTGYAHITVSVTNAAIGTITSESIVANY